MEVNREKEKSPQGVPNLEKDEEKSRLPKSDLNESSIPIGHDAFEPGYLTGLELWITLGSIALAAFVMTLDTSIIGTAIPRITSEFHSLDDVGWYGSAYLLCCCALQLSTGKLYTQFSLKYTFLAFLGIFELGSTICGAAQSSTMLIVGRAVAGMGASGIMNGALTILATVAPVDKRPALLGIMMAVAQVGTLGGPLIGGALTQYASWRWCFYINLPIGGLVSFALLKVKIPHHDMQKGAQNTSTRPSLLSTLDPPGFCLFASFATMLLLALEWGGTHFAWNSPTIIGLFCGAGCALPLFWAWEYRTGDQAMVPLSIIGKRKVWCSCLFIGFFFGSFLIFSYYLPIFFQAVKGVSPALSGVYVLPSILSSMSSGITAGLLVSKLGWYIPWSVASAVLSPVAAGLVSTFGPHTSTAEWVMYQVIGGIGRGCGMQIPVIAVQNSLSRQQIPIGTALVVFSQTFGGSLFLTFAELTFGNSLKIGLKNHAPAVNAAVVISEGATGIRGVVKTNDLPGVLQAYSSAIDHTFYLAASASAAMFVFCWGMGWRRTPKKKAATSDV